jgi:hypothetical protein
MLLDAESLQVETMDVPEQLPDQHRGDRQPSEMPMQGDEAYPQAVSDSEPPVVS